jgi:hypothetical protein
MKDQESLKKQRISLSLSNLYGIRWVLKLLVKGSKQTLEERDIYAIPESFETVNVLQSVEVEYKLLLQDKMTLLGILHQVFGAQMYSSFT